MILFEEAVPEKLIEVLKAKYETDEIQYLFNDDEERQHEDEVIAFIIEAEDESEEIQLDIIEIEKNAMTVAVWRGDLFLHEEVIEFN